MPIREISEDFSIEDIVPYFQPIVDLNSQGVWRYECLARLITQGDKTASFYILLSVSSM